MISKVKNSGPTSAEVWVVDPYYTTSRATKPLTLVLGSDPKRPRTSDEDADRIRMIQAYESGIPLAEPLIPRIFRGDFPHTRFPQGLPDFFSANGYFLVSEKCAAVFREFDLGAGGLVPVEIYEGNCTTRVPGQFYLLNFGCRKSALLPELMDSNFINQLAPMLWFRATAPEDDIYALTSTALVGPDLWHDPKIPKMFFMSGRLAEALRAAKVTRTIGMYTCRIE